MRWQLNVFCIVSARDHAAARIVRSVYEDAIGWCLMQNRGLRSLLHPDGFTRGMNMLGESSADIDVDDHDNRTLQGTVIVVEVEVSDCLDVNAGPAIFIPDPGDPLPTYPDDPDAETVVLDETVVAVTDPLP
jgi:hypothetical protein